MPEDYDDGLGGCRGITIGMAIMTIAFMIVLAFIFG